MKLTKDQVKRMLPGQTLAIVCKDAAELDSTYQVALQARAEIEGREVSISRSNKTMIVGIRVDEKKLIMDGASQVPSAAIRKVKDYDHQ